MSTLSLVGEPATVVDSAETPLGHLVVLVAYARARGPRGADRQRIAGAIARLAVQVHALDRLVRVEAVEAEEIEVPDNLSTPSGYEGLVDRVRESIARVVPSGSGVAIVSRGDAELLRVPGRITSHFPAGRDGGYAGFYPFDGTVALAELRRAMAAGFRYLAIPETGRWWLDFYGELAAFLRDDCRALIDEPDVGVVFELSGN